MCVRAYMVATPWNERKLSEHKAREDSYGFQDFAISFAVKEKQYLTTILCY